MSLLQMSVAGGAVILFVIVIRALAIHRLPKTTFLALWIIVVLRLLLPLSIPLPISIHTGVTSVSDAVSELVPREVVSTPAGQAAPSFDTDTAIPAQTGDHVSAFAAIWLTGVILLALYFLISYMRGLQKFRMSLPDSTPFVQNWLLTHQIDRPLAVRISDLISSPLTYGVLRPVILLPKNLERKDEAVLKYILTHEYIHIRRFDAITKIGFVAALCIHWFNPLVWVMYILANRDMELSCDDCVIRMLGEEQKSAYALALINMEATKSGVSTLYSHFSKFAITERIEAIMKYKKSSTLAIALALVLVIGATTVFAAAGTSATEINSTANNNSVPLVESVNLEETGTSSVRVDGDGFYYYLPTTGWDSYGAYFCGSAYETDSRIEITGFLCDGWLGEIELYESMGWTKVEERDGLAILAQTETINWADGSISTCQHEIYIYGRDGQSPYWTVELFWVEENVAAHTYTAAEPEILRNIARSFTILNASA